MNQYFEKRLKECCKEIIEMRERIYNRREAAKAIANVKALVDKMTPYHDYYREKLKSTLFEIERDNDERLEVEIKANAETPEFTALCEIKEKEDDPKIESYKRGHFVVVKGLKDNTYTVLDGQAGRVVDREGFRIIAVIPKEES